MAKKAAAKTGKKAPKKAAQPTEAAKPSEVRKSISAQKLKALISSAKAAETDISVISGGLGSEIKIAIEKHGLDRWAFNIVKRASKFEAPTLKVRLDNLQYYLEALGLNARAAQVVDMQFGDDEGAAGDGDDDASENGENGDNVHDFPQQNAVAAE